MGSFPHELPGYRHISRDDVREIFDKKWGVTLRPEPGLRIPNMFDSALGKKFLGLYVQGEDIAQSDPNTTHVHAALRSMDMVIVQDLFLNETSKFAHVFLPGTSFLEKMEHLQMPNAVSIACAQSWNQRLARPNTKLHAILLVQWVMTCHTHKRQKSWMKLLLQLQRLQEFHSNT
jgi:anaerobic selenocysteine-containing dehydrogenase